jgi:hypothetical protein
MVTVAEFRKWLEQFPQDAEVEVAVQQEGRDYCGYGPVKFISPELKEGTDGNGWEYTDLTGNPFVKETEPHFGKKCLFIGEQW